MGDLTVIYITANAMPEHWNRYQRERLTEAANGAPIISISRTPIEFGAIRLIDNYQKSYWNIYRQLRIGAEAATTAYVAMAEDDVLYTREHFSEFRPPADAVSYNRSRWSLFAWERDPIYCLRNRVSNCSLIAPRYYLLDALWERERRWPNGYANDSVVGEVGREAIERTLGVSGRNAIEWWSTAPLVQLNHPSGTDERQRERWKKHGQLKAIEIPVWGKAKAIVDIYARGVEDHEVSC